MLSWNEPLLGMYTPTSSGKVSASLPGDQLVMKFNVPAYRIQWCTTRLLLVSGLIASACTSPVNLPLQGTGIEMLTLSSQLARTLYGRPFCCALTVKILSGVHSVGHTNSSDGSGLGRSSVLHVPSG